MEQHQIVTARDESHEVVDHQTEPSIITNQDKSITLPLEDNQRDSQQHRSSTSIHSQNSSVRQMNNDESSVDIQEQPSQQSDPKQDSFKSFSILELNAPEIKVVELEESPEKPRSPLSSKGNAVQKPPLKSLQVSP